MFKEHKNKMQSIKTKDKKNILIIIYFIIFSYFMVSATIIFENMYLKNSKKSIQNFLTQINGVVDDYISIEQTKLSMFSLGIYEKLTKEQFMKIDSKELQEVAISAQKSFEDETFFFELQDGRVFWGKDIEKNKYIDADEYKKLYEEVKHDGIEKNETVFSKTDNCVYFYISRPLYNSQEQFLGMATIVIKDTELKKVFEIFDKDEVLGEFKVSTKSMDIYKSKKFEENLIENKVESTLKNSKLKIKYTSVLLVESEHRGLMYSKFFVILSQILLAFLTIKELNKIVLKNQIFIMLLGLILTSILYTTFFWAIGRLKTEIKKSEIYVYELCANEYEKNVYSTYIRMPLKLTEELNKKVAKSEELIPVFEKEYRKKFLSMLINNEYLSSISVISRDKNNVVLSKFKSNLLIQDKWFDDKYFFGNEKILKEDGKDKFSYLSFVRVNDKTIGVIRYDYNIKNAKLKMLQSMKKDAKDYLFYSLESMYILDNNELVKTNKKLYGNIEPLTHNKKETCIDDFEYDDEKRSYVYFYSSVLDLVVLHRVNLESILDHDCFLIIEGFVILILISVFSILNILRYKNKVIMINKIKNSNEEVVDINEK